MSWVRAVASLSFVILHQETLSFSFDLTFPFLLCRMITMHALSSTPLLCSLPTMPATMPIHHRQLQRFYSAASNTQREWPWWRGAPLSRFPLEDGGDDNEVRRGRCAPPLTIGDASGLPNLSFPLLPCSHQSSRGISTGAWASMENLQPPSAELWLASRDETLVPARCDYGDQGKRRCWNRQLGILEHTTWVMEPATGHVVTAWPWGVVMGGAGCWN